MAYCTATEAKDKDLSRLVAQAGWVDSDVEDRIAEGDAAIDGITGQMGYAPLPWSPIPALIKRLSILYARYACLRDMHHHFSPSQAGADGYKGYLDQFNALIEQLRNGDLAIIVGGEVFVPVNESTNMRVQHNTVDVPRALTMDSPESQRLDGVAYSDPSVVGGPEDPE